MINAIPEVHSPVLLNEVVLYLAPRRGGVYADCTLGIGGHSEAILAESGPDGRLIGLEWDKEALTLAQKRLSPYNDRIWYQHRNFADLKEVVQELGIAQLDGILIDLGLSSYQLDLSGRGFSFKKDEPLDMRMDMTQAVSAADLINSLSEAELADLIFYYGEERFSRRIARGILFERNRGVIQTTRQLVKIIERAIPVRYRLRKIHAATKTFQALRIAVNHELENLEKVLREGAGLLKPGGRFCIISFHSLEDRLVKRAFSENRAFKILTKKPLRPGEDEIGANPRARSARLRAAVFDAEESKE